MKTGLNLRATLLACSLLAAAAVSWYLRRPENGAPPPAVDEAATLGYYLHDVVFFGTDEGGRILYEVAAQRAEEQPDARRLLLEGVTVAYRPAADVDWRFAAARGEGFLDDNLFELEGGVELTSRPAADGNSTVIRTAALAFEADSSIASSEAPVTVVVGTESLEAVGLRAYLREDRLELGSNVHALFEP